MVYRIYSEKQPGLSPEAASRLGDLRSFLGIDSLTGIRILNRYDVDHIDRAVFDRARDVVFSEPPVDVVYDETFPLPQTPHRVLAVEALPGQFDQRADSCAQCVQLMAGVERPLVAYARVYLLEGTISDEELEKLGRGALYRAAVEGDEKTGDFLAGQISGMINKEQPAAEIIQEMFQEAEEVLKGAGKWVR